MAVVDPIADMLTRIRNAHTALHAEVGVPENKMKLAILKILKEEGYVDDFSVADGVMSIRLKYYGGKPVIAGLKRVSRPGRRVYVGRNDIPAVQNGLGITILSTSKGILEGKNASESGCGGEILCEIW
ncbi:MAG TPA: 30S ribosomal protein S8 [Desulfomicrobiaceae bacterium]|jgi:small subunit ribosomal protein S8|nr:30S ribosomal protein S8 [Desulfomicrobiaceae bacterium]